MTHHGALMRLKVNLEDDLYAKGRAHEVWNENFSYAEVPYDRLTKHAQLQMPGGSTDAANGRTIGYPR